MRDIINSLAKIEKKNRKVDGIIENTLKFTEILNHTVKILKFEPILLKDEDKNEKNGGNNEWQENILIQLALNKIFVLNREYPKAYQLLNSEKLKLYSKDYRTLSNRKEKTEWRAIEIYMKLLNKHFFNANNEHVYINVLKDASKVLTKEDMEKWDKNGTI